MIGRTGRYRVRRGLFGKSILQEYVGYPSFAGGFADCSSPVFEWSDVKFVNAPPTLQLGKIEFIGKEKP